MVVRLDREISAEENTSQRHGPWEDPCRNIPLREESRLVIFSLFRPMVALSSHLQGAVNKQESEELFKMWRRQGSGVASSTLSLGRSEGQLKFTSPPPPPP